MPAESNESLRSSRIRRLTATAVTGLVSRLCNSAVQVIAIAVTVRYLGPERYGLWVNVLLVAMWTQLANFGLAAGLVTQLSRLDGLGDRDGAERITSSTLAVILAISSCLLILFAVIWFFVPWDAVFNVTSAQAVAEAGPSAFIAVASVLVSLPLRVAEPILNGHQKGYIVNVWLLISSLLGLVALYGGIWLNVSLTALLFLFLGAQMLCSLAMFVHTRIIGYLQVTWRQVNRMDVLATIRVGGGFFALQLVPLVQLSMSLVIAQVLGSEQVTPYAVTQKLAFLIVTLVNTASAPLWPAFGEAAARGDAAWVRSTFRKAITLTFVCWLAASIVLGIFGRQIVGAWASEAAVPSYPLLLLLLGYALGNSAVTVCGTLLNGLHKLKVQLIAGAVAMPTQIAGSALLCIWFGNEGVAAVQCIAMCVLYAPPLVVACRRAIRQIPSGGPIAANTPR